MNSLYLDSCPTVIPCPLNAVAGISNSLSTSPLSSRQIQKKKEVFFFSLFRLKTHQPLCSATMGLHLLFFLRYFLQTLTSIQIPSLKRSAPFLLNSICSAPNLLAAYFSHLNPIPVSVNQNSRLFVKKDFLLGYLRTLYARLTHLGEQYFFLASLTLQKRHFIMT